MLKVRTTAIAPTTEIKRAVPDQATAMISVLLYIVTDSFTD